jgi:hypothetical protein
MKPDLEGKGLDPSIRLPSSKDQGSPFPQLLSAMALNKDMRYVVIKVIAHGARGVSVMVSDIGDGRQGVVQDGVKHVLHFSRDIKMPY